MGVPRTFSVVRVSMLALASAALIGLALALAQPAQAAGVVTNCSSPADFYAKLGGGGLVTFNCPFPGPSVITVSGAGGIQPAPNTTIDGTNNGHRITLSGGGANRLIHQLPNGGVLTLLHLTLRDGDSGSANGGCLFNEAGTLLNDVVVTNCKSTLGTGGGINSTGALTVTNSTFSGNSAVFGGGIFNGGTATLANSALSGNSASIGGGIRNVGTLTLTNATVSGNMAGNRGGIENQGRLTLLDSSVNDNTAFDCARMHSDGILNLNGTTLSGNKAAGSGGGLCNGGVATLQAVTINANTAAGDGGGIFNAEEHSLTTAVLTVVNANISGNSAAGNGGAIMLDQSATLDLSAATLSGNSANNGGGIYNNGTSVNLVNVTLSGNAAATGGGIVNAAGALLKNVTLSGNTATQGGALRTEAGHTTNLVNTILAYSPSGGNCSGSLTYSIYSISSDNSCALTGTVHGVNANQLDPLLTALGNYGGPTTGIGHDPLQVHMLKVGSPAIAGVVGNDAPVTDERGKPRPGADGSYDIGAVERQPGDSDLAPRLYLPLIVR